MALAPKTVLTYPLDGANRDFQIPFEYLARKFVQVTLVGKDRTILTLNIDYRFTQRTIITTTKPWGPADGYERIEIRRYTSATERLVDFSDGSILRAYDLNTSQIQSLHIAEEGRDVATDTIGVDNNGNLDARGRRITNLADAVNPEDAVPLRQMQGYDTSALNSANKAKASEVAAKASELAAKASELAAKSSETNSKESEVAAKASETSASTSASTSVTSAAEAVVARNEAVVARNDAVKAANEALQTVDGIRIKAEDTVSITDFLRKLGPGPWTPSQMWVAFDEAFRWCVANVRNLWLPSGIDYTMQSDRNYPIRNTTQPTLMDCKNITVFGDGWSTLLKTHSVGGADVLQLNCLKNIHFRNLAITSTQSGFDGAGSNGISITDGWENITVKNVLIFKLPYIDKGVGADGGKGVTFQSDGTSNPCGFADIDVMTVECVQGVGYEYKPSQFLTKGPDVRIRLTAHKCYAALTIGGPPAEGSIPVGASMGLTADVVSRNCQHDMFIARGYGFKANIRVESTEAAYNKIRRPDGVRWLTGDGLCYGLKINMMQSAFIDVTGWKGACDSLYYIAPATAGASNMPDYSVDCRLDLGLSGTPSGGNFELTTSGNGLVVANSFINIIGGVTSVPSPLLLATGRNEVHCAGNVWMRNLVANDATLSTVKVGSIQGSSPGTNSLVLKDTSGVTRWALPNTNGIAVDSLSTSAPIGTYRGKYAIYKLDGSLLGYVPVYD